MLNLKEILEKHKLWLANAPEGIRADLNYVDLRGAMLARANLSGADLRYADLSGATLIGANLSGADLRYANLRYANLRGADLRGAILVDENGELNKTITQTWENSFKDATHFFSVLRTKD